MREPTTWIKLDRNILEWRWYADQNTKSLFIHLLLRANITDKAFRDITIHRGELATSLPSLASETGLSIQNVRTALKHLESTGELTRYQHGRILVISIPRYDSYQVNLTGNQQGTNRELTGNQQQLKNIRIKEIKNSPPTPHTDEVMELYREVTRKEREKRERERD